MRIKKLQLDSQLQRLTVALIRIYQICIRCVMFNHCRFHPSCSQYAIEAIKGHGLIKGGYLTVTRLLRCHPWYPGGFDPVPNSKSMQPVDRQRESA